MGYTISGTSISLTRGDTLIADISILKADKTPYTPIVGDKVRFAMKSKYADLVPLLVIDIPIDTMQLVINAEDTKNFAFGRYIYDIQLTKSTGEVDTFITKASLELTEEVY